jgi:rhodanese-related sulfurtransferase
MKHVSVTEAHTLQQQGYIYLDVRSTMEFAEGHPAGAVNVPLIEPDVETGEMQANPDFVRVIQAHFPADARLLVGCAVGGRSVRAAQILEAMGGFTNVANVRGGFAGGRDPMGRLVDAGWAQANLPVETGQPSGAAYEDLVARANDPK